jgi:hypothetical protein
VVTRSFSSQTLGGQDYLILGLDRFLQQPVPMNYSLQSILVTQSSLVESVVKQISNIHLQNQHTRS